MLKGIQKLTLIDYPDKIACTLFLFGCNFRCGFCHNPELVTESENNINTYSEEEALDFLEKRKNKLEGVCFTGGEPLLTINSSFLKKIKSLGYSIKIDTNGSMPERLKELINEKLVDYIAMDIKSSPEKYPLVTNIKFPIEKIEESIKIIIESGLEYEFRTTILKRFHDKEDIKKIGEWLIGLLDKKKPAKYFLQGFANKGKLIDKASFMNEPNTDEKYLNELKNVAKDYFIEVGVRV
ncbi:MAG: anaerobic ribonucleoside-triphosphate reductase activating protein [Nanobdellota archaeon]